MKKAFKYIIGLYILYIVLYGAGIINPFPDDEPSSANNSHTDESLNTNNSNVVEEQSELGPNELLKQTIYQDIDNLMSEEAPNIDAVIEDYKLLLSLCANEYVFKTYAELYYVGDVDTDQYDYIFNQKIELMDALKQYMTEDEINSFFQECVIMADRSFDESRFNYDNILIGDKSNPDVDAMWDAFIALSIPQD